MFVMYKYVYVYVQEGETVSLVFCVCFYLNVENNSTIKIHNVYWANSILKLTFYSFKLML